MVDLEEYPYTPEMEEAEVTFVTTDWVAEDARGKETKQYIEDADAVVLQGDSTAIPTKGGNPVTIYAEEYNVPTYTIDPGNAGSNAINMVQSAGLGGLIALALGVNTCWLNSSLDSDAYLDDSVPDKTVAEDINLESVTRRGLIRGGLTVAGLASAPVFAQAAAADGVEGVRGKLNEGESYEFGKDDTLRWSETDYKRVMHAEGINDLCQERDIDAVFAVYQPFDIDRVRGYLEDEEIRDWKLSDSYAVHRWFEDDLIQEYPADAVNGKTPFDNYSS